MLFKVFTLRFSNRLEMFDDSPVNEFIKDKEILCLRDYFFVRDALPYLTIVVIYQFVSGQPSSHPVASVSGGNPPNPESRQRDESWRGQLNEADMPLFNTLRSWRLERCKKDGIPPYVICNNRQLAEIVRLRPTTLAGLMQVDGFGKAKADKYGDVMLKLLATPLPAPLPTEDRGISPTGVE